jgi:hypothetical protein
METFTMRRFALLFSSLLLSLPSVNPSFAQENSQIPETRGSLFTDRLAAARFVGVFLDKEHGVFTLHVYSEEQQKSNLASLASHRIKMEDYLSKLNSLKAQHKEAQDRGASNVERNNLIIAQNNLPRPHSQFFQILLHDVVSVGSDYIEVKASENADSTTLIPFHRIHQVITPGKTDGDNK